MGSTPFCCMSDNRIIRLMRRQKPFLILHVINTSPMWICRLTSVTLENALFNEVGFTVLFLSHISTRLPPTTAQVVVGSIFWAFRRLKRSRSQEMSARGYAFKAYDPNFPSFFNMIRNFQIPTDLRRRPITHLTCHLPCVNLHQLTNRSALIQ